MMASAYSKYTSNRMDEWNEDKGMIDSWEGRRGGTLTTSNKLRRSVIKGTESLEALELLRH